jgi:hypothetical protein
MPLVRAGDKTIFFAHVPKTGGSSVEDYLRRRFGKLSFVSNGDWVNVRRSGLITPPAHMAAADVQYFLPTDTIRSFATVRDPLERIQSEYRFQAGSSRSSRFSFPTWARLMIAAGRLDPRIYFNHVRPQTDLVPEGAEVFRIEDGFERMVSWLDEVSGTSAPSLSVGHFGKRQHTPLRLYREDAELIAEYFSPDYLRFGYEPPDPAQYPRDPYAVPRNAGAHTLARALVAKQRRAWVR